MKNVRIDVRIAEKDKIALQKILSNKGITISNFLRGYIKKFLEEEKNNASKID